ncbi:MAG TPA: DUF1365 domain-containing protein [Burkholderiales bacterium]
MSARAAPSAELVTGSVRHRRLAPVENRFAYRVFFLRLPLSRLQASGNALFSIDRPNLFSLRFRDHGARDGSPPLPWIRALLAREGLGAASGEVWLHAFPRVLGYVFNPVSFWFCEDPEGRTRAVVAEVNNTFGDHHAYLLAHPDARPIEDGEALAARKRLHVSPFLPLRGAYRFRFATRGAARLARIDYLDDGVAQLLTSISGRPAPLTAARLARAFLSHPLMSFGVMARIHWQALRLWAKRVPFFSRPQPPAQDLSR